MSEARRTGVIGGTFDPIHLGHVAAAQAALDALSLDQVLFVPSRQPPHRPGPPRASAFDRFAMVALAINRYPALLASDCEVRRQGPSYTADTLRALHASGHPASQLFFIIGTDAFAEIATWHDYPAVLDLANFAVISRPGQSIDDLRRRLPALASRMREVGARDTRVEGGPGCTTAIYLVRAHTPDVSSTEIRARAAAHEPLTDLVSPDVERYIRRHRLYSGVTS